MNIYLRLPYSRCQYLRNLDAGRSLAPDEPLKFSPYSEVHQILRNHIYRKSPLAASNQACYTQREWQNMTNGLTPDGKKKVLVRDATQWLSYFDILTIEGCATNDKTAQYDYVCLRLPNEIAVRGRRYPTTDTFTLSSEGCNALVKEFNKLFCLDVVDWFRSTAAYCFSNGKVVFRAQQAAIERFLMRYNIDVSDAEKQSLRRVIDRWLHSEHAGFKAYSCREMSYIDHNEQYIDNVSIVWQEDNKC